MAAKPGLFINNSDDTPDYFSICPRFQEAIEEIQKKSRPTHVAGIPVKSCVRLSTSEAIKHHGNTKIYELGHDKLERISATISRTISYACTHVNEKSHIMDIYRYAMDPINYKTFANYFNPLLPNHFVRVEDAHLCFFEDDMADSLPHSHVIMEKINGISLWDYLRRSDVTPKNRMACIAQAVYILILVSNHGYIHNDPGIYNFLVAPHHEAFEMKGAFLPIVRESGAGAGAHLDITRKTLHLAFSHETPRVVLIDYGDSMKLASEPIFPIEAQLVIRALKKYIPMDILGDVLDSFKDMGPMFHLPASIEAAVQITGLKETSQSQLLALIYRLCGIAGGKRRTRHQKQKKTLKKRNHK